MAMVDHDGRLLRFAIRPGNAAESPVAPELLDGVNTSELIADKAYDTDIIRKLLADRGIVATVPPRSNRRVQYEYDEERYRARHLVENLFADLKQFRGLATRYCKLASRYESMVNLAWWVISSRREATAGGRGRTAGGPRKPNLAPEPAPLPEGEQMVMAL
ncbi:MAG: IS5 family transposase [Chloroflexi bacterium]|nr:IS5 family transposase [Chloroflexota bacterium]MYD16901.1 IS5 family transposase [Chloroflexota bacterium]MYJ00781.1 IS5 family transposase [Chloroflexota bacterium]